MTVASRTVAPEASELDHQLEAALVPSGHRVLHRFPRPGSSTAAVDHLVIGPTGVWVITHRSVQAALLDAAAVSALLDDVPVRAVVVVDEVGTPVVERNGALLADAASVVEVITSSPAALDEDQVVALTAVVDPSEAEVIEEPEPVAVARRKRRWRPDRGHVVAAAIIAAAAVAAFFLPWRTTTAPLAPATEAAIEVTFECRHPGSGWTQLTTWTGFDGVESVLVAPAADGPWTELPRFSGTAVRDLVMTAEPIYVRVVHADGEATTLAHAPETAC